MSLTPSDYGALSSCIAAMEAAVQEMDAAKDAYGKARATVECSGDTRKTILAIAAVKFLDGESNAVAETLARATEQYASMMRAHKSELAQAEATIAQYYAIKAKWETERSKASAEKAMVQL